MSADETDSRAERVLETEAEREVSETSDGERETPEERQGREQEAIDSFAELVQGPADDTTPSEQDTTAELPAQPDAEQEPESEAPPEADEAPEPEEPPEQTPEADEQPPSDESPAADAQPEPAELPAQPDAEQEPESEAPTETDERPEPEEPPETDEAPEPEEPPEQTPEAYEQPPSDESPAADAQPEPVEPPEQTPEAEEQPEPEEPPEQTPEAEVQPEPEEPPEQSPEADEQPEPEEPPEQTPGANAPPEPEEPPEQTPEADAPPEREDQTVADQALAADAEESLETTQPPQEEREAEEPRDLMTPSAPELPTQEAAEGSQAWSGQSHADGQPTSGQAAAPPGGSSPGGEGADARQARPRWRESEKDVDTLLGPGGVADAGYRPQQRFAQGEEHGGRGSSIPDGYRLDDSLEVKNYNLSETRGRDALARELARQSAARDANLPEGTRQTVILDVRGQVLSQDDRDQVRAKIEDRSDGRIKPGDIFFLDDESASASLLQEGPGEPRPPDVSGESSDVPGIREQWDTLDQVPDHIRARVSDEELAAMSFPLVYEKGPAAPGEAFRAYTHHDWADTGADGRRVPVEGRMDEKLHWQTEDGTVVPRRLNWASPAGVEQEDKTVDATYDIQERAALHGFHVDVETIRRLPDGSDALGIDVRESRALIPDRELPRSPHARDASWPVDAPFPGGAPQVRLLDYDPAECHVVIEPVGEMVDLQGPVPRYDYPEHKNLEDTSVDRRARDEARNARVTATFRPGAMREMIRSLTAPQKSEIDRRGR